MFLSDVKRLLILYILDDQVNGTGHVIHPSFQEVKHVVVVATQLRTNETYVTVYINWMYLIVMYVIPFGILVVLNYR